MSNEITKVGALALSVQDMMSMADLFIQSGMFADSKNVAQAFVKIKAGQELGVEPFAAMNGINIIVGKAAMGSNLIASRIKGSGKYDYKIVELNDKTCSIDFFEGKKNIGNSKFTIEDAKKQQTKNMEKFPKNMLFARAISNGARWYTPDVFNGPIYTPEDFEAGIVPIEDAVGTVVGTEPAELPEFTEVNFEKAKAANATIEQIKQRYTITPEVEKEYTDYVGGTGK